MTREERRKYIRGCVSAVRNDRSPQIECLFDAATDNIMEYLHSQGGVIKVKCPDCEWSQFEGEVAGMTPCYRCNSSGYIVEPLI